MDIDVALIPMQTINWRNKVCIVIDVLRASSTIVTLLEGGVRKVIPVRDLDTARQLARAQGWVLAGEENGVKPADFDYSNSPSQLARADLAGKVVTLATSNGTVVLDSLQDAPRVFVGCFLNAAACCRSAVEEALRLGMGVGVVCAGHYGDFVLDDAVCAGYLVGQLQETIQSQGGVPHLSDAAFAARQLYHSFPTIMEAFLQSNSGKRVLEIGEGDDNPFCSQVDVSQITPVLLPGSPNALVVWRKNL